MSRNRNNTSKYRTVRGLISSADVDEMDGVLAVTITDEDDYEYLIYPYGIGEDLMDFVGRYVEVNGTVHNDDGDFSIEVRRFRCLDDPDDDYLQDDDDDLDDEHLFI